MRRNLKSLYFVGAFLLGSALFAQVTGTVNDGNGFPESDVEVSVKGTDNVVYTDMDGNFDIDAQVGDMLIVNGKEVVVTSANLGVISTSEPLVNLEEVVVTGYGTVDRTTFVGTASEVKADDLRKKNVSNVTQALAGEVAGVRIINTSGQPGSDATIRVRGFGSVNGSRDPLIVLDGMQFYGTLASINPEDIASLTVLKDATATAIYGSRGANGVVVISTKQGSRFKSEIVLENKTGVNSRLLPRYDVISSPEEFLELGYEGLKNYAAFGDPGSNPTEWALTNLIGGQGLSPSYNMWNVANGSQLIDPATGKVRPGVTRKYDPENWEDYGFQTSIRTETNLNISGGDDRTQYYTSFGYIDDQGYIINSRYERYSTRLNVSHKANDWLSGSLNVGYALSKSKNNGQSSDSGSIFWFVDNIPSIYPLFLRDENGNTIVDPHYGGNIYDYGETGRAFGALTNSIADATYDKNNYLRHEVNANAYLKADILPYLSFEVRLGGNYNGTSRDVMNNMYYGSSASSGGSIYKYKFDTFNYNFQQILRFNKRFGDHGIAAMAAHESTAWEYKTFWGGKSGLINNGGVELDNATVLLGTGSYLEDWTLESYFANASYDYNNKYLLSATVRRDGSSRFVNPDLKWGTFWSVGAGWVASREDFLRGSETIPFLKLKASYGTVGDQAGVGYYPGYNTYLPTPFGGEIATGYDNIGYPELTWEVSKIWQVGAEFSLFKNSFIDASVDFYSKTTDDLIFDRRLPVSSGASIMKVNDGQLLNQGLEFDVKFNFVRTQDAFLTLGINGEMLKNEITSMPFDPQTGAAQLINVQGVYGWSEGHSIYDFYMREWAGVNPETGRAQWAVHYVDNNGNGAFDAGEQINSLTPFLANNPNADIKTGVTEESAQATLKYVNKSAVPDLRGAFTLNAGYKGLSLSAQFLYSLGGYAVDYSYQALMHNRTFGNNNWHADIRDRWQNPGDVTDVPRLSNSLGTDSNFNAVSTKFLTKADYLALNNVRIGYDLSERMLSNTGLSGLSVFVSGDNLWITSARKGFNPSTAEAGESNTYRYAPLTTFTLGVRAKF